MMRIAYGLVDRASEFPAVEDRLRAFQRALRMDFHELFHAARDAQEIISWAIDQHATHLVMFGTGTVVRQHRVFRRAVEDFIAASDFVVSGHIIHHAGRYPRLHEQYMLVDLRRYVELGRPALNANPSQALHTPARAMENVHDDYTPLWLDPTGHHVVVGQAAPGAGLISASLDAGYRVLNVPPAIRQAKLFAYPHLGTERLATAFNDLAASPDAPNTDGLDVAQRRLVEFIHALRQRAVTYVLNTERIPNTQGLRSKRKRLFVLAAGFLPLLLWHRLGDHDAEVVFYDHLQRNLDFWESMLTTWDGHGLRGFVEQFDPSIVTDHAQYLGCADLDGALAELHAVFGSEDAFRVRWREFQQARILFVRHDLINDAPQALIGESRAGDLIWFSNAFHYKRTLLSIGAKSNDDAFARMIQHLHEDTAVIGLDPSGRPIHGRP